VTGYSPRLNLPGAPRMKVLRWSLTTLIVLLVAATGYDFWRGQDVPRRLDEQDTQIRQIGATTVRHEENLTRHENALGDHEVRLERLTKEVGVLEGRVQTTEAQLEEAKARLSQAEEDARTG